MSASQLYRRVYMWVLALSVYAAVYLYAKLLIANPVWAQTLETLVPIAVAVAVVCLAADFNRRNSYLHALRDFWRSLVPAAQTVIQYTHLSEPSKEDFARAQEALSTAIDELRGVFENIPVPRHRTGLYPYENLKDIKVVLDWLSYGEGFRGDDVHRARACIVKLWQEMHSAMLSEFDRAVPARPVSKFLHDGISLSNLLVKDELRDTDLERQVFASHPRDDAESS